MSTQAVIFFLFPLSNLWRAVQVLKVNVHYCTHKFMISLFAEQGLSRGWHFIMALCLYTCNFQMMQRRLSLEPSSYYWLVISPSSAQTYYLFLIFFLLNVYEKSPYFRVRVMYTRNSMLHLFKVEHNQYGVRNPLTTYKFVRFMNKIL